MVRVQPGLPLLKMSKAKVQDDKILLRLPSTLTDAVDQTLKEQIPSLNRSEFIRRAVRFTLDNVEAFKTSESANIHEGQPVESVERTNAVRDLHEELTKYSEILMNEPNTPITIKQLAFLNKIIGQMIFRMNE